MAENKSTLKVEVKATTLETRSGIKAKKGDVIEIPAAESKQTGAIRHALRSGNLKVVTAETDLAPVRSEPVTESAQKAGEVRRVEDSQQKASATAKKQDDKKTSGKE